MYYTVNAALRHKNTSFDLHTSNQFFLPWI